MIEFLSHTATDKMHACLNQSWAEADYMAEKDYYEACISWWEKLTPELQAIGLSVMQALNLLYPENAEKLTATLPPAPVCPSGLLG